MLATDIGPQDRFKPATLAYWQRLQARPGFLRALEAQTRAALEQGVSTASVACWDGR